MLKSCQIILILLCFAAGILSAENLLPQLNFQNTKGWNLPRGYSILPVGGKYGDQVLQIERSDTREYLLGGYSLDLKKLEKGQSYHYEGWVKCTEKCRGAIAVEFTCKGKFLTGSYSNIEGNGNWKELHGEFNVPEAADRGSFTVYMQQGGIGQAQFCGLKLEKAAKPPQLTVFIKKPVGRPRLKAGMIELTLGVKCLNFPETSLLRQIRTGDGGIIDSGPFNPKLKEIKAEVPTVIGNNKFIICITDAKGQKIAEDDFLINVIGDVQPPQNACVIDERGRALVNGKKFMPLGLYYHWNDPRVHRKPDIAGDIQIIAKSPFNCVMDYNAASWPGNKQQCANYKAIMDLYHTADLKVIFPTSWINHKECIPELKSHPALLAWYTADETAPDDAWKIKRIKEQINQLDPWHPTWAVYALTIGAFNYAPTCDVLGYDSYPIVKGGESLEAVVACMTLINSAVGEDYPIWMVPQFYNSGNYSAPKDLEKWRRDFKAPTEDEMTAICFIEAIMGAKGFIGYSFFDLRTGPEDHEKQFAERWPVICRVGTTMKEAEPFIMGDTPSSSPRLKTITGSVLARSFTADDGRRAVMIATPTAKGAEAVINLEHPEKFKSLRGCCSRNSAGQWRFTASGCNGDLLYESQ